MIKKLVTLVAAAAITFSANAQNARIDAMGGCSILSDITNIPWISAYMSDYTDQIQGTAYSASAFGPVIGIKGVGDKFKLGAMANDIGSSESNILWGRFYSAAKLSMTSDSLGGIAIVTNENLPDAFPVFPHLLFGVDLDVVKIGLDVAYEKVRYKDYSKIDTVENETNASISTLSFLASAIIPLGKLYAAPLFGVGFPKSKASNDATDVQTMSSIFLAYGVEAGLDLDKFSLIGGFFGRNENYQFKADTVELQKNKETFLDIYAGLQAEVLTNLTLVTQYDLQIGMDKDVDTSDDGTYIKSSELVHNFRLGLERPIDGVWVFDEIIPRAGLKYSITDTGRVHMVSEDADIDISMNNANLTSSVELTVGLGLRKGIATVDIATAIGSWNGVLSGPSVIAGTLTLDFGKTGGSSRSSSSDSAPSPVLSPAPESDTQGSSEFKF